MSRENFRVEMKDGEQSMEMDGSQYKAMQKRLMDTCEPMAKKTNEVRDIRDKVTSGSPFAPSAEKILARELKASEKPSVGTNADLHSDTTDPGDNVVTSMGGDYARKMSDSAEWLISKQKDKKVPDAVKRKVFNS